MKKLLLASTLLFATACSTTHEVTQLDRELALKLADRPQVIMAPSAQATPVVVNVTNNPVQAQASEAELYKQYLSEVYPESQASAPVCHTSPIYHVDGSFSHNFTKCW